MLGTTILSLGVLAGLMMPGLAAWLAPLLPATVFTFVCATFLRADAGLLRASLGRPREAVAMPVILVVLMPITLAVLLAGLGIAGPLASALVITLACPPSSANAALARLFGYGGELPLTLILVTMIAAPVTMPLVAGLVGIAIDPWALLRGLAMLLGSAGALAILLRLALGGRIARRSAWVDRLILGALLVFAVGAMDGVQAALLDRPLATLGMAAAAFALSATAMVLGLWLAPAEPGARPALALAFGNRNVGLPWAVLGGTLDPAMALFFALFQLPIFVMPLVLMLLSRRR